ncbi:HD domain-containing phosphohydrolase [Ferrimicrobium sp.]|uniref:HD-GYP domain-containing protein n=1 Tax=Ferrimicrobium sp. TaxID=2926050 RepID=UPI0026307C4E|nr:HD domain-containing phosphohydrolase [Ferrimicrobium sp.]
MKDNELDESNFYRKAIVGALNRALYYCGEPIANHSKRVGILAGSLAAQIDPDRPGRLLIAQAGIVRDAVKLGIGPAILAKTGLLTPDERTEAQRRSAIGGEMLLDISPTWPLAVGVRVHYERCDGTGYPDGLLGGGISLSGRLLVYTDVYDALTSPWMYRNSHYTSSEATTYLEEHAVTQIDPQVLADI